MEDLEAATRWPANAEATLQRIHRRKTGALLTVATRVGGLYAGVDPEADERLKRIGEGIGLMFQMVDDVLDVEGDADALGKAVGKDGEAGKLTYPGLFGLARTKELLGEVREGCLSEIGKLPRNAELEAFVRFLSARDR